MNEMKSPSLLGQQLEGSSIINEMNGLNMNWRIICGWILL